MVASCGGHAGRELVLQELHRTHPGCAKMKSIARNYIWWPKMDSAIEDTVKQCQACQEVPSGFCRPIHGINVLVLVDAHSKRMDVHLMQTITSAKTIEKLCIIFANRGIPHKVVTDNGPTFTSYEFQESCRRTKLYMSSQHHITIQAMA